MTSVFVDEILPRGHGSAHRRVAGTAWGTALCRWVTECDTTWNMFDAFDMFDAVWLCMMILDMLDYVWLCLMMFDNYMLLSYYPLANEHGPSWTLKTIMSFRGNWSPNPYLPRSFCEFTSGFLSPSAENEDLIWFNGTWVGIWWFKIHQLQSIPSIDNLDSSMEVSIGSQNGRSPNPWVSILLLGWD